MIVYQCRCPCLCWCYLPWCPCLCPCFPCWCSSCWLWWMNWSGKFQVPITMDSWDNILFKCWFHIDVMLMLMISLLMFMLLSMLMLIMIDDGWVDPENFWFLSQWIAELWYFISVDVHVDVDDVLVDVNVDVHIIVSDVHPNGNGCWAHPENFRFLSLLRTENWYFPMVWFRCGAGPGGCGCILWF